MKKLFIGLCLHSVTAYAGVKRTTWDNSRIRFETRAIEDYAFLLAQGAIHHDGVLSEDEYASINKRIHTVFVFDPKNTYTSQIIENSIDRAAKSALAVYSRE